jgi:aminoglycoside phosphotransferase (APT) family kinase protein
MTAAPDPTAFDARAAGRVLARSLGLPDAEPSTILDAKHEPGRDWTVLYRIGDRLVTAGSAGVGGAGGALDVPELGAGAWLFPDDPALPGLADVLDVRRLTPMLAEHLPACREGARIVRCAVTTLRYRPRRRCTLRIDLRLVRGDGQAEHVRLFGKVYHDARKARAVWDEMRLLAREPVVANGALRVAAPVAHLAAVPMVVQGEVCGLPFEELLGPWRHPVHRPPPGAAAATLAAARAIAALHACRPVSDRARPATTEAARMVDRGARAAASHPQLGRRVQAVASCLYEALARHPPITTLVHGDCKPSQFLLDGGNGVALLDFDHCGVADPATDVGTFVASLRQLAVRQSLQTGDGTGRAGTGWLTDLGTAAVEEYLRHAPLGTTADRVRTHEAVALVRKALRAHARSPRSPLPAALVGEAERLVAGGDGHG